MASVNIQYKENAKLHVPAKWNFSRTLKLVFTARKRSLRRLFLHVSVILSMGGACVVAPGGACMVAPGGVCGCLGGCMHGCSGGVCMVAPGGQHAWLLWGGVCMVALGGGMCGCLGVCMVAPGGVACVVAPRGHMVAPGGTCMGYDEIQRYDQ